MLFSSLTFLYVFLPIVLLLYYTVRKEYRNNLLFIASIIFFAWGGASYSILLIFSIVFNFFIGKSIANKQQKKLYLGIGISVNLLFLGIFKYAGFIVSSFNSVSRFLNFKVFNIPEILLPIGISFYTFQAISYLIDLYRNDAKVQLKITNLGLFISLFPQLIAGPIVRYHDIANQIKNRSHTYDKFANGVMRFVLGLAKKVLIANNLAILADYAFNQAPAELSVIAAWCGIIAYTFQIYYDFAGYSDMAIGLAKMFGFDLLENFNFPYMSRSIQEFWRRWHISLSSWFRDYLYIPLGGNRGTVRRTYMNLIIVFFVTGLWHGSSWNFVIWGLVHGFFLIIERLGLNKILKKLPSIISGSYTLFIAMMAWVLFRADSFSHAYEYFKVLFGLGANIEQDIIFAININNEFIVSLIIALFGAFGGFIFLKNIINRYASKLTSTYNIIKVIGYSIFILTVIVLITTYLANNTYNPFIYFRF